MTEETNTAIILPAAAHHEWESDEGLRMRIRLVSFSNSAKPSACNGKYAFFLVCFGVPS